MHSITLERKAICLPVGMGKATRFARCKRKREERGALLNQDPRVAANINGKKRRKREKGRARSCTKVIHTERKGTMWRYVGPEALFFFRAKAHAQDMATSELSRIQSSKKKHPSVLPAEDERKPGSPCRPSSSSLRIPYTGL